MKAYITLLLLCLAFMSHGNEEDALRELQKLDESQLEFDFYQEEVTQPTDEQNLIEALELLEDSIDSSASIRGESEQIVDPIESITLDQESLDSQLLETMEDEMESTVEQGLEDEIIEILEEEFEEPDDVFNEEIIDDGFGEFNDVQ